MSLKNDFCSSGYVVVKHMLSSENLNSMLSDIHIVFKQKFQSDGFNFQTTPYGRIREEDMFRYYSKHQEGYIGCMRAIQKLPIFYQLATSEKFLKILKEIGMKYPIISQEPLVMLNNKKTSRRESDWKVPSHQDWRSRQGSINSVAVWMGLVDITDEVGPVQAIPKSHLKGLLPAEGDEWYMHVKDEYVNENEFVSMLIEAGDAIIFSQLLIHRSGNNKSDKFRYSLQIRYDDLFEPTFMNRNYPNIRSSLPSEGLITPNFPTSTDIKKIFETKN